MPTFLQFQTMAERLLNSKIISVQSDWSGEYRNLHSYFQTHGITHCISCPHTHQQQGCVERKHRHLIDTTLALLAESHLPQKFWDEACLTSCYLINRLPTPLLQNKSPFEKLFNQIPDYKFLKVFGCACFPNLRPYNSHKFSPRSKECLFLGYSQHHKGYKCLHLDSGRVYISRDVIFHEDQFPFAAVSPVSPSPSPVQAPVLPPLLPTPPVTSQLQIPAVVSSSNSFSSSPSPTFAESSQPNSNSHTDSPPVRVHPMRTRSMNHIFQQRQLTDGTIRYPVPQVLVAETDSALIEPTCFSNAVKVPEWRNVMQVEYNALLQNQTWSLVAKQPSHNLVGCKWVFKLKRKADGSIERHKARLVAKGFHQQAGVDFGETYSPVVKPTTIRTVLSLAFLAGWSIKQIDI
jgi:hypothetical protein